MSTARFFDLSDSYKFVDVRVNMLTKNFDRKYRDALLTCIGGDSAHVPAGSVTSAVELNGQVYTYARAEQLLGDNVILYDLEPWCEAFGLSEHGGRAVIARAE